MSRTTFQAIGNPSGDLAARIAALAPANPFSTPAYVASQRELGFEPWALCSTRGDELVHGCYAFARSGRLNRDLEITSVEAPPDGEFWDGLLRFCREDGVTKLQVGSFASSAARIPHLDGEVGRRRRVEYVLDLDGTDLWSALGSNHRRNVKRGRKADLELRRVSTPEVAAEHARLMRASTQRREERGEEVHNVRELDSLRALLRHGVGEVFQAVGNGEVLSSMLVCRAERGGYYQSAGTTPEGMQNGASHFLIHGIAERLQEQGAKQFNLGGAEAENPGLQRFKAGFGAEPVELEAAEFYVGSELKRKLGAAVRWIRDASPMT